jgi:hypothetical protein
MIYERYLIFPRFKYPSLNDFSYTSSQVDLQTKMYDFKKIYAIKL